MKFEILSVAEDSYESTRFSASQKNYTYSPVYWVGPNKPIRETHCTEVRFSLDINQTLTVREYRDKKLQSIIKLEHADIDGLIAYLHEAKAFISEEKMVAKLMGKR